jgi:U3 small nucleolar RNA-associated protein 4
VSGDSLGKTSFWEGRHGTLLSAFQQHHADVLALGTNKFMNKVFAVGVDNKTSLFQHLDQENGAKQWVYTYSQRCHTHDVYCPPFAVFCVSSAS